MVVVRLGDGANGQSPYVPPASNRNARVYLDELACGPTACTVVQSIDMSAAAMAQGASTMGFSGFTLPGNVSDPAGYWGRLTLSADNSTLALVGHNYALGSTYGGVVSNSPPPLRLHSVLLHRRHELKLQ
jgi:hypothetical protein